jgi:hypothetical protein
LPPRGWVLILAACCLPHQALPIVMRHDVPEQRFIELARKYPAAVSVRPANGWGAEGTLIGPRWVLTAAHVAEGLGADAFVEAGGKSYLVERVFIHPEWQQMTMADLPYDLALLRLKLAVPGIEPALLFNGSERPGSVVTFVGRGASGTGLTGPQRENRQSRAATNRVDKVEGAFLQFRFDGPGDPAITELEGISGPGDSGGGAFQEIDGKLYLLGISSWQDARPTGRKQGLYGVIENYVRVAHHHEWLTRTMNAAP